MKRASAIAALAMLACASVHAQTVETGQPLIVDSNGQEVGPVIGAWKDKARDYFATLLWVDGEPVYLNLAISDVGVFTPGNFGVSLVFETTNCSGPGYLVVPALFDLDQYETVPAHAVSTQSGLTLTVATSLTYITGLNVQSEVFADGACFPSIGNEGLPTKEVQTGFVEPFEIKRTALVGNGAPLSVPAVTPTGLALLFLLLLAGGWWILRR